MGPFVSPRPFADLTDVTLADEDTNSILADNDKWAIQGNVAMQVVPPDVQMLNQCKWRHIEATYCNLCKWLLLVAKIQDFNQISGFQPNFRILTKYQDFD